MTIDNPQEVKSLIKKMEAILPIPVRGTPELLKTLANQGDKYKPDHEFLIEKILYAGDEGGISCVLKLAPTAKSLVCASLTHLRIANNHPLADEIQTYQKKRAMCVALEDGKKGKAKRLAQQSRPKKGFG